MHVCVSVYVCTRDCLWVSMTTWHICPQSSCGGQKTILGLGLPLCLLCCYRAVRCCINLTDSQGASGASPLCASHLLGRVLGLNRRLHYRFFYSILLLRGNLNSGFKSEGQAPLPIQPDLLSSSFIFVFIIVDKHLLWGMLWNFPNIIELFLPGQQFVSSQERKASLFTSRGVVPL